MKGWTLPTRVYSFSVTLTMEAFNSSVSILNNISKVDGYPDNITISPDESNGTTGYVYSTAEIILVVSFIIIVVFGSIGNILTFIIIYALLLIYFLVHNWK